jgi:nucleoside-triphosphatase
MLDRQGRGGKHALLLTGPPGVGKTTVVRRVAGGLAGRRVQGFTTEEIRVGGQRLGFRLETFDGRSVTLAHVDLSSRYRVGRYRVDVATLDDLVDSALAMDPPAEAYLIDEIGRMECLSARFVAAVTALLDSGRPLVATVAVRGGGLIENAKRRPDAEVRAVTRENRDALPSRILAWLGMA